MTPIPDRYDMAHYAQEHFCQTGNAVEVGVYEGDFSAHNLQVWQGQYVMVDAWGYRHEDAKKGITDKNDVDDGIWKARMNRAEDQTAFAFSRRMLLRAYSTDAAELFDDGYFDWIYLDAGHDEYNCGADLNAWWPKLRVGGLMSGDDYGLCQDKTSLHPLTADRWAKKYGNVAKEYNWGTAPALYDFCEKNGAHLNITWLNDRHNPAWYIVK